MHTTLEHSASPRRSYPQLEGPRYPSLDLWRGLACLMILIFHAAFYSKVATIPEVEHLRHPFASKILGLFQHMQLGVPMFFVISGYCISATADSSRRKMNATKDYFKRRLRRIFPPFWAALIISIGIFWAATNYMPMGQAPSSGLSTWTIPSPASLTHSQWLGNFTLTETWRPHIDGAPEKELMLPSWTLCYEEQFYVVCGLLILLAPRRFFSGALLISVLIAGLLLASFKMPRLHLKGFFFDGQWLMFAAGIFVYYTLNYVRRGQRWLYTAILALVILALKVAEVKTRNHASEELSGEVYSIYASAIFAFIILLLRPFDAKIANARILLPIALCGTMCYSLYLIHWAVTKVLGGALYHAGVKGYVPVLTITVPVLVTVSLLAAWGFYQLVERHFLNSPSRLQTRAPIVPINSQEAPLLSGVGPA